jgi:membrane-associated phospholipid phosphatase
MDALYQTGIDWIVFLQTAGWLEAPMRFFTFLGTTEFFFLVLPVVYWCIDAGLGMRIAFILLLSNRLNEIAKLALLQPRPYWISARVKALAAETSFGVPSGHAQLGAGVWGTIAAYLRRPWVWIVALLLIFLIGLSRLYLGVHFPHDVLTGWLLGGLTLWAFAVWWDRAAAWVKHLSLLKQVLLIFVVAAVLILVQATLVDGLRGMVYPWAWVDNAAPLGGPMPPVVSMEGMLTMVGALIGLSLGLILIDRGGGFKPSGPVWKRALCFLVGLIGVAALYFGLKAVLPLDESLMGYALRTTRYAAIGLWISAGAPWAFWRLRLIPPR